MQCNEGRLIGKTDILLPPQVIAVVATISTTKTGTKDKIANVIANPFLCVESPSLYMIPTAYIHLEKALNQMFLFIANVNYKDLKIGKGNILVYLTPAQYDSLSKTGENNNESVIANISATTSETEFEILPVIPVNPPLRQVALYNAKISADTQDKTKLSITFT